MEKSVTAVSAALLLALAACGQDAVPPGAAASQRSTPDPFFQDRQQVDAARERIWRLGQDGVFMLERAVPAKLVRLQDWQWAAPPYGCLPDLALGPNGEAIVTSNVLPVLWRVDPRSLAVTLHTVALEADGGRDAGFSALAWSPEHRAYFAVSQADGALWRI